MFDFFYWVETPGISTDHQVSIEKRRIQRLLYFSLFSQSIFRIYQDAITQTESFVEVYDDVQWILMASINKYASGENLGLHHIRDQILMALKFKWQRFIFLFLHYSFNGIISRIIQQKTACKNSN